MDKIASPADLQAELRKLLAYAESKEPSREKLASGLSGLADRVAKRNASGRVPLEKTRELIDQAYRLGQFSQVNERQADRMISDGLRNVDRLIRKPGPPSGALVSAILDVFWSYGAAGK